MDEFSFVIARQHRGEYRSHRLPVQWDCLRSAIERFRMVAVQSVFATVSTCHTIPNHWPIEHLPVTITGLWPFHIEELLASQQTIFAEYSGFRG